MKLKNDLVVLDIESTGVWIEKDRIIEIALLKYKPDGSKEVLHTKVNPGMAIPAHITELTGISDRDVQDSPTFKSLSRQVANFLERSDFGGYNIERFDLPLLQRELSDAGIAFAWDDRKIYDAQKVYHLNEKRDLSAAYQFYCGKDLVGAHSALADSEAVYDILKQQLAKYGEGREDIAFLEKFEYVSPMEFYDEDRKFCWWNGKLYPSFGKFRRKLSLDEIARKEPSYLNWLLKLDDMKEDARTLIENAMRGDFPVR
ncbi:MAG: 3'-5' exonuclease [Candidatus Omnitrophica bacterium]|nr:3'-5' exonuclease [Candidatus Omnitrophota bacterium]